jgi:hypothetical protein
MSQMKTTFHHPNKRRALLAFVVLCALFVGSCVARLLDPNAQFVSILFMVGLWLLPFAGFCGYQAFFCSDEWHVLKEEHSHHEDYWLENHPRIRFVLAAIPLVIAAFFMVKEFLPYFSKH